MSNISFRRSSQTSNFNFRWAKWKKKQRTTIGCFGKHIPHSTKAYTETESVGETAFHANAAQNSTEQHSTALHKVSARKLLFALPQANPWTQLTTVYHWCNNTAYILYISLADGFWYRFCFLCNKFQGITWIRRNWFHFRNLYLWTKKTQTTVWIHCIAKQSISLYSVGTVTIKTFRIPFWRTCK